ncbi:MAG TPA: acetolactate synthase small subunit [Bacillota bacterium]
MQHVMVLVADVPGVLRRITGLYGSRGYQVRNVSVGPTGGEGTLRINLALDEPPERAERFARQLERLVDVIAVDVVDERGAVGRELALVKVAAAPGRRAELIQVAEIFRARVVDAAPQSIVFEITGDGGKIDAFLEVLREFGILEIARTGTVALRRGAGVLPAADLDQATG